MKNLKKLIEDKYISVQKHPEADLFIYNYTQKAQFDKVWTEETLACRGLIMDKEDNIISRPFKKFFNLEEQVNVPAENFEVFEKWDGSLGISYWLNNKPYIATRGSFISEQAVEGTKMIQELYMLHPYSFLREYTYLFEIIYPENRIVVDYKGMRGLVLLAVIETKTGKEVPYSELKELKGLFNVVKRYEGLSDITKIRNMVNGDNKEGFVVRFESGLRLKLKFEEYVRLHRLVTGINARHVWENLKEGKGIQEMIDRVPDEFMEWVKNTANKLENDFKNIEFTCKNQYKKFPTRKEAAFYFKTCSYPQIMFSMLDKKNYSSIIWKIIKPAHEVPFKKEI